MTATLEKTLDEFDTLLEESFAKSNNVADIVELIKIIRKTAK